MGMPPPVMTMADYMAWENVQVDRHEFHRGETYAMVGGTRGHNRVIVNLTRHIGRADEPSAVLPLDLDRDRPRVRADGGEVLHRRVEHRRQQVVDRR